MKCPKCGFGQPDDIYCALCGINVKKYAQKKRTRYLRFAGLGIFAGIAALIAVNLFSSSPTPDDIQPLEPAPAFSPRSGGSTDAVETNMVRRTAPPSEPFGGGLTEESAPEPEGTGFESARQEPEGMTPPPEGPEETLETAEQWFAKGRALDDDSEAEIACYETALGLDAEFAPAAFYLGAIHFRKARYELADEYFTAFLRNASDRERQLYDIYVYYSLADVERLYDGIAREEAEQEEAAEEGEGEAGEPPGTSTDEELEQEVLTVVEYRRVDGHITVPILLNGFYTTRLLVDTGAGITILSRETARQLGLQETGEDPITLRTLARDVRAERGRLDSIQVGNLRRYDFPVAIADPPFGTESKFSGILGMDFMKDFSITISNETRRMTLSNQGIQRP